MAFQNLTIHKPWGCGCETTRLLPAATVPQARTLCRGATCGVPPRPGPRPPACAPLLLCPKLELSAGGKLWGPPQAGAPDQALRAYAGSLTPRCFATLWGWAPLAPRGRGHGHAGWFFSVIHKPWGGQRGIDALLLCFNLQVLCGWALEGLRSGRAPGSLFFQIYPVYEAGAG